MTPPRLELMTAVGPPDWPTRRLPLMRRPPAHGCCNPIGRREDCLLYAGLPLTVVVFASGGATAIARGLYPARATWRSGVMTPRRSFNAAMVVRMKAGKSAGDLEVTSVPSRTTSRSTQFAPAL